MLTEQKTVNEKIEIFFDKQMDYKDFAQQLRRATYIIGDIMSKMDAEQNVTKSYWANDCFYHLNEFAELLQPILEDEK
jgi:hypothetical protein